MAGNDTDRSAALERLYREMERSDELTTMRRRSRLVFGTGDPAASVVLIGEAPGADEEKQGRPFVGRAGQLLDKALEAAGLDRSRIWISNVVKIRPTQPGARGGKRNRPPTSEERAAFLPWLLRELEIVAPDAVVCLGATAAKALLDRNVKIGDVRGQWLDGPGETQVLTTYHPAYLLRPFKGQDQRFDELVGDLRKAARRA